MGRRWSATERKAKLLGVFITSDCEADAYAPLVHANIGRYAQRALKVRVKVGAEEIAVKERGLVRWKTDRLPVRLLRTAHSSLAVPELAFFVVQTDDRRFKVLAFLCKTADDAWCLVERARQSRQLRDALRHSGSGGSGGTGGFYQAPPLRAPPTTRSSFAAASLPVASSSSAAARSSFPCHCDGGGDHQDSWCVRHRWSSASLAYADPRRFPPPPETTITAAEVDRWAWRGGASDETDDEAYDDDYGSEAAYGCGDRGDIDRWSSHEATAGVSRGSWLWPPPPPIGFVAGQRSASAASPRSGIVRHAPPSPPSYGYWTAERASTASGRSSEQFGERLSPQPQLPTIADGSSASRARRCRSASDLSHELLAASALQQEQQQQQQPPPSATDVRPASATVEGVEWRRRIDQGRSAATLDRRTFRPSSAAPCERAAGSRKTVDVTTTRAPGTFATLPHSRSSPASGGGGFGTTRRSDDSGQTGARSSSAEGGVARVLVDHGRSSRLAAAAATQSAAANIPSSTLSRKPAAATAAGSCSDPRRRLAGDLSRVAEELTDARQDVARELYDMSAAESSPSPPWTGRQLQPTGLPVEPHQPQQQQQQQQQWCRSGGYRKCLSSSLRRSASRSPSDVEDDDDDDAVAMHTVPALARDLTPRVAREMSTGADDTASDLSDRARRPPPSQSFILASSTTRRARIQLHEGGGNGLREGATPLKAYSPPRRSGSAVYADDVSARRV